MCFLGNPGTGKTTVARIVMEILYNLKYIKQKKLIEVSSKDLVAEYVGQTAPRTMAILQKAMGGVLFIDEAYSLASGSGNDNSFNDEAIATLVQGMENYRDNLVVIFAGYTKEMQAFLNSNSGIVSRIGYTLEFEDYTDDELIEIFNNMMTKCGLNVKNDAIEKVRELIKQHRTSKNFGNARFIRNVYEKTVIKHSVNTQKYKSNEKLKTMLYYIFRFLEQFNIPGAHIWSYISFRSLLALILSLIISAWFGEYFIKWMKRRNISETARDPSIDPFGEKKKGVPTMGGIIIIVSILVPVLLLGRMRNIYLLIMIVTTVWLGFLGFMDDYIKIFKKNKEGLKGIYKIIGQVSIGFIVGLTLWLSPDAVVRENITETKENQEIVIKHNTEPVKSLQTTIPFIKNHNLNYSNIMSFCGKYKVAAGWILFVIMTILAVTAVSNGANLNDGMDGMCAGNSAIIGVALLIFAYVSSHIVFAAYFDIMYIPGSQELVVFLSAFTGAMIGFLWYNAYPAQVFMGDTGSLTIGGIIGVCAIIIHKELMLPILCGIFFIESLSVIIQTQWFKLQKRKGKRVRVFRATPIHDTFRRLDSQLDATSTYILKGWPHRPFHESKITIRFWIVSIILAALAIITLKVR